MIIKLICSPFILMINGLINLLPTLGVGVKSITAIAKMISIGLNFFPSDLWILVFGCIVFWFTVNTIFGIYMFILDLIPVVR